MSEALAELRMGLRTLSEAVEGLELEDAGARLILRPGDGLPVEVDTPAEGDWRLRFAGFELELAIGAELDEAELVEDALDFAAAAIFGELRVLEERAGAAVRRTLEVRVGDRWRSHASTGRLGLRGLLGVERRVHEHAGCPRPPALRAAGPSGLPSAPWHGAAGLSGQAAEAAPLPLDGELDLHNFSPKQVAPLVREYIAACREVGVLELRVVHGKGKGVLRRTVHSLLDKHPAVADYRLGGHGEGSWGATVVTLRPLGDSGPEAESQ